MKKLLLALLLVLFVALPVFGQEWYTANQVTFEWSAVTKFYDGEDVPNLGIDNIIKYKVFSMNHVTGEVIELGVVAETEYTHSFLIEGAYFFGVQPLRYIAVDGVINTEIDPIPSQNIAWSNEPQYTNNETWGVRYFLAPGDGDGLKLK